MSKTATSYVHTGPWINWSHGIVLGSTITLSQRDGELLTAFLGIFVTAAGAACWKLMSFALHQHRSPRDLQDGFHHQQQTILRNTGGGIGASFELVRVGWAWRKHARGPFMRTLPLAALALVNFVLFSTYIIERFLPIRHSSCGTRHTCEARGRSFSYNISLNCSRLLCKAMLTLRSAQALLAYFPQKSQAQPETRH